MAAWDVDAKTPGGETSMDVAFSTCTITEKKQTRESTLRKHARISDAGLSSDGQDSLTDKQVVYTSMLAERLEVTEHLDGHREVRYEAHRVTKQTTAVVQAKARCSKSIVAPSSFFFFSIRNLKCTLDGSSFDSTSGACNMRESQDTRSGFSLYENVVIRVPRIPVQKKHDEDTELG
ncbi:hypothetical protein PHYPSEUDO_009545 [Phytophthora pseudosyringae]|uniref:Uncharacterized protein n=1 Tax=Phytophthora pseudosyringae TaxID=221518 RepID=A0A8T1WJG7_9STRA|nr:hypothetical protein PHYPSEUDO_009545 [Phytophthora pseudosyringae]